jgi:hypothetical protein
MGASRLADDGAVEADGSKVSTQTAALESQLRREVRA